MVIKRESVPAPADSSETNSRSSSEGPASSSQQHPPSQSSSQGYPNFQQSIFNENTFYMQQDPGYILPDPYSPSREENQNGSTIYARYHPYQHQQRFLQPDQASSINPRSPQHCEKCGVVYEDLIQLAEHVRSNHHTSPNSYPDQSQYQQLRASPQHQRHQQPQMHTASSQTNQQQQSEFDYSNGTLVTSEIKVEEEQAEILDLDSHKVQTHRYEEDMIRAQQEMQMQLHQHSLHHQRNNGPHSVSSMLNWPSQQAQEFHPVITPMAPMENNTSLPDQSQFMRGQHISMEPPRHGSSPIITSTQSLANHPLPPALIQQSSKTPLTNQSWKSNEARRPKTYNCTACNKWFTSSGHLKRHYNTTLHKNAVKVSNQPDPANLPISAHHHPGREVVNRSGSSKTPELSSSASPPNLMAGPLVEATRGLLHTPNTSTNNNTKIHYNSINSNNNNSESSGMQGILPQQQQVSSMVHMSNLVPLNCQTPSPMGAHNLSSPTSQMGQHTLPIGSPSQMAVLHSMSSPMSPMQHPSPHMNSPSPMGQQQHHHQQQQQHHHHHHHHHHQQQQQQHLPNHQHHHMSSLSPMMGGVPTMTSPPPMGGTTMPHQPYPNGLPPHVTTTTSIQGPMQSITSQTTTGNSLISMQFAQDQLPAFGTISNQTKVLPYFINLGTNAGFNIVDHSQPLVISVGGLSQEENLPLQDINYESSASSYHSYKYSPQNYESLTNTDVPRTSTADDGNSNMYKYYDCQQPPKSPSDQETGSLFTVETNNNLPHSTLKEELNPNIRKQRKTKLKTTIKKERVTKSNSTETNYISRDGVHKCIECNKFFNKACYLTQHNKSFHSGDKPFKCSLCGKRFPFEVEHAHHLRKHAGDKPYKCGLCPKQFNHKTDLRRHMCLHTGEKPYTCDTCGKGFIRKDHMMKHIETHRKKLKDHHNVHFRA